MRMLMNNLDPEVAERPDDLVVYGGTGRAARSWDAFDAMVRTLQGLGDDETMLVQSGKPVGVFRTHEWAPRVLIANSNLVPEWGTWEEFRRLEQLGLTMYGQMTAGSWIYIGTQGILQGTYECFAEIARRRFGGSLAGTITLTAGLGGMGGAQPLAVTMNDGVALCVDVDGHRIERRLETRYLDEVADGPRRRHRPLPTRPRPTGAPLSIGLRGNAADVVPRLLELGLRRRHRHRPDQRARPAQLRAQRPVRGGGRATPPSATPTSTCGGPGRPWRRTARRWSASSTPAPRSSTTATACGPRPASAGSIGPSTTRASCPPTSARCSARARARSAGWRSPATRPTSPPPTQAVLEEFPDDEGLARWIRLARERVAFQGLPARICWLGYGERHRLGLRFNELVRSGRVSAPIVIGRDHLDSGSVASPYRETEAMADGSDAIADWPLLNALREHVVGRVVGQHPPRRRGGHRALDPRRHGVPGRRDRPGGREARAASS